MQNRLYVGNLAADVTAGTLQEIFERHGFVMDVKLVTRRNPDQPTRFAFVMMATDAAAQAAIRALDGATLHGGVIAVAVAQPGPADVRSQAGGEP